MATPQSTTSYEGGARPKKYEEIKFTFCPECSNLLYPKEHDKAAKLTYLCRTCQYQVEADQSCVFRNVLNSSSGETAGVTQDVGSDPTVSDIPLCLHCGSFIWCSGCGMAHPVVMSTKTDAEDDEAIHIEQFCGWDYDADYAEYDMEAEDSGYGEFHDERSDMGESSTEPSVSEPDVEGDHYMTDDYNHASQQTVTAS